MGPCTLRQHGGCNAHENCVFCTCTPEMYKPPQQAFSPHISRGYSTQQNSQPVKKVTGESSRVTIFTPQAIVPGVCPNLATKTIAYVSHTPTVSLDVISLVVSSCGYYR